MVQQGKVGQARPAEPRSAEELPTKQVRHAGLEPVHRRLQLGYMLQRLVLRGLGAACWACEEPLAVGELGPWCSGCSIAVEAGPDHQSLDGLPVEALWTYAGAVAVALGRAKSRCQALPLAVIEDGWRRLARQALRRTGANAVCAMPPHQRRLIERGWSLPDQLALASGCDVRWPLVRLDSQAPRRMDRQELPVFGCQMAPKTSARLLIIDDVVTTGATLRAARLALSSAGWTVTGALVLADAQPQAVAKALAGDSIG